ncbi:hypothetical protein VTL71DRAFT_2557 [Oculimacula yallundae]|uniref:SET domain-containing protein n=1 Tax=Oculimacula yallundae TaxID=86028 RepID=A0ABR4CAK3_9HELO
MSSIVQSTDPGYQQLQKVLESHKNGAHNASRRTGERPKDLQTREQCVSEFDMASMSQKMRNMQSGHMMMTSVTGNPYPPSIADMQDLKRIMIKDLMLENHHRGSYMLLRFVCKSMRMTAIMNVAEDETGMVIPFAIYMQEPEAVRKAESILRQNCVIILKEPYFKLGTNGQYAVRVDQPTDIVWLADDDSRIPTEWKVLPDASSASAEYWKRKGNEFVGKSKYYDAIEIYTKALWFSPPPEELDNIYRNRALAYLRTEAFDFALKDISYVSDPQEKGLYRKGLALYGLGRFKDAFDVFQILIDAYPGSKYGNQELNRCRLRVVEQETGIYDFRALYKATALRPPRLDIANFIGPVEVRDSTGRGRGLFTTQAVEAGEILLCEKAFAYCYAASPGEAAKMQSTHLAEISFMIDVAREKANTINFLRINSLHRQIPCKFSRCFSSLHIFIALESTKRSHTDLIICMKITVGTHADLIRVVSNKLVLNPSLRPLFEDLYGGDYEGIKDASADGSPVIDTFLVARTVHLNCFSCPLTSKDTTQYTEDEDTTEHTTGLWITSSYINHSCMGTCDRSYIGDMQIVRAARDMPAGTELTFSYIALEDTEAMKTTLMDGWGFECDCARCADDRSTSSNVKAQRQKLIESFNDTSASLKRKRDLVSQLNKTYQQPASQVPRFDMWDLYIDLVTESAQHGESEEKLIDEVVDALESVGFVIEGARVSSDASEEIVVRQWGAPHHEVTAAWLTMRNRYKALGLMELADQAKEFARIGWMLRVGEDTSFVYDNPPPR